MTHYYGDRSFLDDSLFTNSENIEFHSGSTTPVYAGIRVEYGEVGRLDLSESEGKHES